MGYMGYIELLKQGNTLICNYKYICKYINLDFTKIIR